MAAYTSIDNPELLFQCQLYTGNGSADHAITFDGSENMQPDLVWIKQRDSRDHFLFNSVVGATKYLASNTSALEETDTDTMTGFNADGFTLGSGVGCNENADTHVSWNWKETTGVFDIVTYTGNGSARTISHNLGVVPQMMIVKKRSNAGGNWQVNTAQLDANQLLELDDLSNGLSTDNSYFNNTRPTSSVFSLGTDGNQNTNTHTYIAYLFGSKQGVSKVGKYLASSDSSSFIFTGFKPAFLIVKQIESGGNLNWGMFDNRRPGFNSTNSFLYANDSAAEDASNATSIDLLSNGFQLRANTVGSNPGKNYIYMAFAESPFVNSKGVPNNSR
tara:strand:- start:38 stop:1033 length:996 start_codon:yes stop_codon:yes gene_type:complete